MPQKRHTVVPTLQVAEADRNTPDVEVDQQWLGKSAGGDSLPSAPLPDDPLPEACPDGLVVKE
jgi:hypothetical protein